MESALDLLVFVAVTVYKVSPSQLTVLMLSKLLAQEITEALFYKLVSLCFVFVVIIALFCCFCCCNGENLCVNGDGVCYCCGKGV